MNRTGIVTLASAFVAVPLALAACGDDGSAGATLPPIVTTTSSTLPAVTTTVVQSYYEVQAGDNLGNIARVFGVSIEELMALNGITNPNKIEIGQTLAIPPSTLLLTMPGNS